MERPGQDRRGPRRVTASLAVCIAAVLTLAFHLISWSRWHSACGEQHRSAGAFHPSERLEDAAADVKLSARSLRTPWTDAADRRLVGLAAAHARVPDAVKPPTPAQLRRHWRRALALRPAHELVPTARSLYAQAASLTYAAGGAFPGFPPVSGGQNASAAHRELAAFVATLWGAASLTPGAPSIMPCGRDASLPSAPAGRYLITTTLKNCDHLMPNMVRVQHAAHGSSVDSSRPAAAAMGSAMLRHPPSPIPHATHLGLDPGLRSAPHRSCKSCAWWGSCCRRAPAKWSSTSPTAATGPRTGWTS